MFFKYKFYQEYLWEYIAKFLIFAYLFIINTSNNKIFINKQYY